MIKIGTVRLSREDVITHYHNVIWWEIHDLNEPRPPDCHSSALEYLTTLPNFQCHFPLGWFAVISLHQSNQVPIKSLTRECLKWPKAQAIRSGV